MTDRPAWADRYPWLYEVCVDLDAAGIPSTEVLAVMGRWSPGRKRELISASAIIKDLSKRAYKESLELYKELVDDKARRIGGAEQRTLLIRQLACVTRSPTAPRKLRILKEWAVACPPISDRPTAADWAEIIRRREGHGDKRSRRRISDGDLRRLRESQRRANERKDGPQQGGPLAGGMPEGSS